MRHILCPWCLRQLVHDCQKRRHPVLCSLVAGTIRSFSPEFRRASIRGFCGERGDFGELNRRAYLLRQSKTKILRVDCDWGSYFQTGRRREQPFKLHNLGGAIVSESGIAARAAERTRPADEHEERKPRVRARTENLKRLAKATLRADARRYPNTRHCARKRAADALDRPDRAVRVGLGITCAGHTRRQRIDQITIPAPRRWGAH